MYQSPLCHTFLTVLLLSGGGDPIPYKRAILPDSTATKSKYVQIPLRHTFVLTVLLLSGGGDPVPYKRSPDIFGPVMAP